MTEVREQTFSIGEVVAALRPECDVTESNLRFWEREGLLAPRRSAGGHRLYTAADMVRIKRIRGLQANRHLSLAVIKGICARDESEWDTMLPFVDALFRPRHYQPDFLPLDEVALAAATGLSDEQVTALTEAGVLVPAETGDGPRYDEDDREIARMLREVMALGVPLEAHLQRAALVQAFVQAEWETVVRPHGAILKAIPLEQRLRLRELFEELELLVFNKARRRWRDELWRRGEIDGPACAGEGA